MNAFFHVLLYGANSPLIESNEELRMEQWNLHSSFLFFQDNAIKTEIIWSYYHLFYLRRTKIKRTLTSIGKRPTTHIQVAAVNVGDQVERWK